MIKNMSLLESRPIYQFNLNFIHWQYYVFTLLFVGGNVFFPLLAHQFPTGGPRFLPIYFFVLIGAYKFGLRVGITTAIISPLINHFLTGMPPTPMLPTILIKGIAMAFLAAIVARKTGKISFKNLAMIIIGYQAIGMVFEGIYTQSMTLAFQDAVIGYPGLLIQLFIGYFVIWLLKEVGNNQGKVAKTT